MVCRSKCARHMALAVILFAVAATSILADTIIQTNAQGEREVVQTNAIVTQQDSQVIIYKHFDLKQRRVEEVQLNQGSLPYEVVASSPSGREQIVALWKKFGYTTTIVDLSGKSTHVYDTYLDFFPPPSVGTFLESVPPRTNLPVLLDNGGVDEIDFDKIASIQIQDGHLKVTLTDGRSEAGKFLMPTREPAIARFMGITRHYSPASKEIYDFSVSLNQVKEIQFAAP